MIYDKFQPHTQLTHPLHRRPKRNRKLNYG